MHGVRELLQICHHHWEVHVDHRFSTLEHEKVALWSLDKPHLEINERLLEREEIDSRALTLNGFTRLNRFSCWLGRVSWKTLATFDGLRRNLNVYARVGM